MLSDQIPAGAVCTVTERLEVPPAPFRAWAEPVIEPGAVVVAKRQDLGSTITNRVKDLPPPVHRGGPPRPHPHPDGHPHADRVGPGAAGAADPVVEPTPSTIVEPTNRPELPGSPSAQPTTSPTTHLADRHERLGGAERRPAAPGWFVRAR